VISLVFLLSNSTALMYFVGGGAVLQKVMYFDAKLARRLKIEA
jgi:hypothetical protein